MLTAKNQLNCITLSKINLLWGSVIFQIARMGIALNQNPLLILETKMQQLKYLSLE